MTIFRALAAAGAVLTALASGTAGFGEKLSDARNRPPNEYWGAFYPVHDVVTGNPAMARSNAASINAAIAMVGAEGGGTVQLPCGMIYVGAPILNNVSRVLVKGCGRDFSHDAGSPTYGTTILPSFAGTVLQHQSPAGRSRTRISGGGFVDLNVDGNAIGTRLLEVYSVSEGHYNLYLKDSVGKEAAYFGTWTTGTSLAEAADLQHAHINITFRQIDGPVARKSNGVVLDGSRNANFSMNDDVHIQGQTFDGIGLVCKNADNNIIDLGVYRAGGGKGSVLYGYGSTDTTGCYSNFFRHVSGAGAIYMRGTSDGDRHGVTNAIGWLDTVNGTPNPSAGSESYWSWVDGNALAEIDSSLAHALIGGSASEIFMARSTNAPTTSLDIVNGSADHLRLRTPTGGVSWGMSIEKENLRAVQLAGAGGSLVTSRVQLQTMKANALPPCTTAQEGTFAAVIDSASATFNAMLVGGGSNHVAAYCNGAHWTVH